MLKQYSVSFGAGRDRYQQTTQFQINNLLCNLLSFQRKYKKKNANIFRILQPGKL